MEKLPLPLTAGDAVLARGEQWTVENVKAFSDCVLFQLVSRGASQGQRAQLLHPFDRIVSARVDRRPCIVHRRHWIRRLRQEAAELRGRGQLRAARSAGIEIFPFQLEPALAVLCGESARILLADEVGLGKTIQAALVLAELRDRGWCERALIVSPSGLCVQWADELKNRFSIDAAIFDMAELSRLTARLPFDRNPWSVSPVIITSIDFLKQPEVLTAVAPVIWDLVIVDEAHRATPFSLRHAAVEAVARRARHVVLITATPHDGDEAAYQALCAIGQIDGSDSLLLFRRTRESAALGRRRTVRLLPVRPRHDEEEMHRQIGAYARTLWRAGNGARSGARLVSMILSKRAMSSASSLLASIERRIAGLPAGRGHLPETLPSLPFDAEESTDLDAFACLPGLEDVSEEQRLLGLMKSVAQRAARDESKMRALTRLLRRVTEPAIVFTEYRDTLAAISRTVGAIRRTVELHGGLSLAERRMAVDAFNRGAADLLLATDAGSEGLNLQSRCRLVINLELPWNPMRLEQRIGRVDRIGQSKTVHVVNLFAAGTPEASVLARLNRRLTRIHSSEIEIAACIIDSADIDATTEPVRSHSANVITASATRAAAEVESSRLRSLRSATPVHARRSDIARPLVCLTRARHSTGGQMAIWFLRGRIVNGRGMPIEDVLVPLQIPLSREHGRARDLINGLSKRFLDAVTDAAQEHLRRRAFAMTSEGGAWIARAAIREQQIAANARSMPQLFQDGLFDHRLLREREHASAQQRDASAEAEERLSDLECRSLLTVAQTPSLEFLFLQC